MGSGRGRKLFKTSGYKKRFPRYGKHKGGHQGEKRIREKKESGK